MKTLTKKGGTTWDNTTDVLREVPFIKSVPAAKGKAKTCTLKTALRVASTGTYKYTIYLFKTFKGSSSYWDTRTDNMYQYPASSDHYMKKSYIADILASGTFSDKLTGGAGDITKTKTLTLTEYGEHVENWAGKVYIAIINNTSSSLYWGNGTTSTLTIQYNDGIMKVAAGGSFVDCEVYYGVDGGWQQVQPYYATGDAWVETGE